MEDDDIPGRDENPPEKIYLLDCGHFGPLTGCQQCFDEYDKMCREAIEEWNKTHENS